MKPKLPLVLLFIALSCSSVLQKLDQPIDFVRNANLPDSQATSCIGPAKHTPQLVGSNPAAQQKFHELMKSAAADQLDDLEKIVLWSLLQINIRPDLASPTARFQFLVHEKGIPRYYDFSGKDETSYPFFEGLAHLIKTHAKKRKLEWYAQFLDKELKGNFHAEKTLAMNLRQMSSSIASNQLMRKYFFRGDELLRENERLNRVNLVQLVKRWNQVRSPVHTNSLLFTYRKTPQVEIKCNYDFTLYDNSIFLIDKHENHGHLFGLTLGGQAFLAVLSQTTSEALPLFDEPVFSGNSQIRSSAFCHIQKGEDELWITANQSRDPGQHVYHLFRYGLINIAKTQDIERLINHSRHMFLSDPLRLVIESGRSRNQQIQELLKLNIPIYHADTLGNIWAWAKLQNDGGRFFIDNRNPGALLCAP